MNWGRGMNFFSFSILLPADTRLLPRGATRGLAWSRNALVTATKPGHSSSACGFVGYAPHVVRSATLSGAAFICAVGWGT